MGDIIEWMEDALGDYNGLYDDAWAPEFYPTKKIPTCKFCGKFPLRWKRTGSRWFLHERDGKYHDCPERPLSLDVLKDLLAQQQKKKSMSECDDFRDTIGNSACCGGRGKCKHCGNLYNNVSYHEAHECVVRPGPIVYDAVTGKLERQQLLSIPSWDETFMHEVYWWARRSKDPRTKIGAVLVLPGDKDPISHGYNGFARAVNDNDMRRWERPEKYEWIVHAEDNAVLNCARKGQSSKGAIMYTQGVPCTRCADAVIQGGIVEVVVHEQWQYWEKKFGWDKWIDSARRSEQKFKEAGVNIRIFGGNLGMQGVLDGKIINI